MRIKSSQVYSVYNSVELYNVDKPVYSIGLYQSDNVIIKSLFKEKISCDKIAIIRNRDIVIFDVVR
jgi:hypothetical protein